MTRLAGVGMALVMAASLAVMIPASAVDAASHNDALRGRTTVRGLDERIKRGEKAKGRVRPKRAASTAQPPVRKLHVVAGSQESESQVLSRLLRAVDEAVDHPALSIGWHAALTSARNALAQAVEAPQTE